MPLYTMVCRFEGGCAHEHEVLCKYDERKVGFDEDTGDAFASVLGQSAVYLCPEHSLPLVWKGVELPQTADMTGLRGGNFQVKGITHSGRKIDGHFGKSARNRRS